MRYDIIIFVLLDEMKFKTKFRDERRAGVWGKARLKYYEGSAASHFSSALKMRACVLLLLLVAFDQHVSENDQESHNFLASISVLALQSTAPIGEDKQTKVVSYCIFFFFRDITEVVKE
jgi:hypothetical protein